MSFNSRIKILVLIVISFSYVYMRATTLMPDSIYKDAGTIKGITVTSKRVDYTITSSKPLQILDKDALERLDITSLADAVKMFAGTTIKDYGGIGGMKTVSIRNMGTQHTAVSYDGITISNTQAGQIDLSRYSLDNVESVELAIGESDDLMLTARHMASAGVLFINTERPHFDYGHNYSFRFGLRGGSFGQINPTARYWQKLGKTTNLSIDLDYMRADGIYPFTLENGTIKTKEKRYNSDINSFRGEVNLYQKIKEGELDFKAYWFYSSRGLPGSVILYNTTSASERLRDQDFFTQAHLIKKLAEKWELSASVKYVNTWNKYVDTNVKYSEPRYHNNQNIEINRQNECYASATIGWMPLEGLEFSLAEDLIYNSLRSNEENGPEPNRYSSLTALTGKYSIWRLNFHAGVVGTFITEDVKSKEKPEDRRRLSPTVSLSFRILRGQALFFRLMYKNTFRVPTFNDMYYERMGTISLSPEKADEFNAGFTWQGKPFGFTKYVTFTIDGYYNNVRDKIVAYPTLYVWKMANFGKVRMYGMNVTLGTEISIIKDVSLIVNASYSLQNSIDVTDKNTIYYKSQIPYTPKNTGSGSVIISNPWLNIGYSVTASGRRYSLEQNTYEYLMKSYWDHNLSVSHEFVMKKCRLNLQGSIKNLSNKQYEIVKYYPMPGRSWALSGTYIF